MPSSTREKQHTVDRVSREPSIALTYFEAFSLTTSANKDVIVSVLEAAATRRDAKGYLQKYADKKEQHAGDQNERKPKSHHTPVQDVVEEPIDAAIVYIRLPQKLCLDTIYGIAKTLTQLRTLGVTALVVLDCGIEAHRQTYDNETFRFCGAIGSFGSSGAKLADDLFFEQNQERNTLSSRICKHRICGELVVDDHGRLDRALRRGMIVVVPSMARQDEIACPTPVDGRATALALTRYLTGLQFKAADVDQSIDVQYPRQKKVASIERIILLDPFGGIPMTRCPGVAHRLINLEQEYHSLLEHLEAVHSDTIPDLTQDCDPATNHIANLSLAKHALSFLPSSSSALITTPLDAVNRISKGVSTSRSRSVDSPLVGIGSMITTRSQKNTVLHNLLTNRPVYSPSLPLQRIQEEQRSGPSRLIPGSATLVKRGMPVTIYPDTRLRAWRPPEPGAPRLRLTDKCIDLPRLVFLIEDSFARRLDVQSYLTRLHDNLAGIIIAGEYEGAAILTWERPSGVGEQEAHAHHRFVPYLDKLAVLRSRQGSSGVADIVFNAMVQNCFPGGVCWRSRKDNPVNRWYFERSVGTRQLPNSNWAMFWTTLNAERKALLLQDYESVCREIVPTWADQKHILD